MVKTWQFVFVKVKAFFSNLSFPVVLRRIFPVVTMILLIMTSGYSALEFEFSNRISAILYISLFLCSLSTLIIYLPFRKVDNGLLKSLPKRLFTFKNIFTGVIILLFLISFLSNMFKNGNLNGSIRFLLIAFSSLFLVTSIPFKYFCRVFCYAIAIICGISFIVFIVCLIIGASGATNFFFTGKHTIVYSYGYFSFFLAGWLTGTGGNVLVARLCGPFWEPSIFAAIIIIAMMLLIISDIKPKIPLFIIYFIALLLTISTGGYFMMLFVGLIFLSEKIRNTVARIIIISVLGVSIAGLIALCLGPLMPFLMEHFPTLFEKFKSGFNNIRFTSILHFMKVYIKSPIFGFGINGARLEYNTFVKAGESMTSTTGLVVAAFGVSGIIVSIVLYVIPALNKNIKTTTCLLLSVAMYVLINLENMLMISLVILVLCYLYKEGLYGEKCLYSISENKPRLITTLLSRGESGTASKNMIGLLVIKGLSMIVSLFIIPVYNTFFITNEMYGIWSVIISVVGWTLLLDFGFGSGMRAKLADAIDKNDESEKKKIVSSTYVGSLVVGIITFIVIETLILVLDLNSVLSFSTSSIDPMTLKISFSILAFGLSLEFILKNIVFINYAEKRTIVGASYSLISNLLLIVAFLIFKDSFSSTKMISASVIYALASNLPFLMGTIIYFLKKKNRPYIPTFKSFNFRTCRSVMSFGILFFLIQVGFLLIVRTDSPFISHIFGPVSAGDYSKYYRVFSFFIGLMGAVVQQPIWSAVASSAAKNDSKSLKKFTIVTLVISLSLFFVCLFAGLFLQIIFDLWLGDNSIVVEPFIISCFIIYSFVFLVADALIIIANGLKILLPQAIMTLVTGIFKIVFLFLVPHIGFLYGLGWGAFMLVDSICYLPFLFILPIMIAKRGKEMRLKHEE